MSQFICLPSNFPDANLAALQKENVVLSSRFGPQSSLKIKILHQFN